MLSIFKTQIYLGGMSKWSKGVKPINFWIKIFTAFLDCIIQGRDPFIVHKWWRSLDCQGLRLIPKSEGLFFKVTFINFKAFNGNKMGFYARGLKSEVHKDNRLLYKYNSCKNIHTTSQLKIRTNSGLLGGQIQDTKWWMFIRNWIFSWFNE